MYWEFTCYNGTVWEAPHQMDLTEGLARFKKETGLTDWDIKFIINKN